MTDSLKELTRLAKEHSDAEDEKSRRAAGDMYSALLYISKHGDEESRAEAILALKIREGVTIRE